MNGFVGDGGGLAASLLLIVMGLVALVGGRLLPVLGLAVQWWWECRRWRGADQRRARS